MSIPSEKPVILIFPFDLMSHYIRTIQLAETLRDEYQIHFVDSPKYGHLVEQAGFSVFPCLAFDAEEVMARARKFDFSWLDRKIMEDIFSDQIQVIREFNPVAIIGDTAPTLKMAAETTETTYISLMNGYMTKYYAYGHQLSRTHPAAKYKNKLPVKIFDGMTRMGEKIAFRLVHRPFKKIRSKYGLEPRKMYLDELEGDFNLICDIPELFPQKDLLVNYTHIGPLFYEGQEPENEIRHWLDNGKKNILVSVGSSGNLNKFAFLNQPYFKKYNIIVAGSNDGILKGPHIKAKPFINTVAIMEKVDLALLHGGNGSIYQALAYGVPILTMTSIFEQEWNVQALSRLGLGASLDDISDAEELRRTIEEWIGRKSQAQFQDIKHNISVPQTKKTFKHYWQNTIKNILPQNPYELNP